MIKMDGACVYNGGEVDLREERLIQPNFGGSISQSDETPRPMEICSVAFIVDGIFVLLQACLWAFDRGEIHTKMATAFKTYQSFNVCI